MKHILLAKSSTGEPYEVTFEIVAGRMMIYCTCKAGVMGQQCKHKRALASGDSAMLANQSQNQLFNEVIATPEAQTLTARLNLEEAALVDLEKQKSRLAANEKEIKRRIGRVFQGEDL